MITCPARKVRHQFRQGITFLLVAATLTGCGDDPLRPDPTLRLVIRPASGDLQTFFPDRPLPAPLVVRVTDSADVPQAGVPVIFAPVAGGPIEGVSAAAVETSADGTAEVEAMVRRDLEFSSTASVRAVTAWIARAPRDTAGKPSVVFHAIPALRALRVESLGPDTALVVPADDTTRVWVYGQTSGGTMPITEFERPVTWASSDTGVARVVYPADPIIDYMWHIVSGASGRATVTAAVRRGDGSLVTRAYEVVVSTRTQVVQRNLVLEAYAEGGGRLLASGQDISVALTWTVYEWTGARWAEAFAPPAIPFSYADSHSGGGVAVTPAGVAFAAIKADSGEVYRIHRSPSAGVWVPHDPPMTAISPPSAAADGAVYVVARGVELYRWDGSTWTGVGFPAVTGTFHAPVSSRVAAVSKTEAYLALTHGDVRRRRPIVFGPDRLFRFADGAWTEIDLPAPSIADPYSRGIALEARPGRQVHLVLIEYRALRRLTGTISGVIPADARLFRLSGTSFEPVDVTLAPPLDGWMSVTPDGLALLRGRTASELARQGAGGWTFVPIIGDWRHYWGKPAWVDAQGRTWLTASKLGPGVLRVEAP